jgi:hypothetical protein
LVRRALRFRGPGTDGGVRSESSDPTDSDESRGSRRRSRGRGARAAAGASVSEGDSHSDGDASDDLGASESSSVPSRSGRNVSFVAAAQNAVRSVLFPSNDAEESVTSSTWDLDLQKTLRAATDIQLAEEVAKGTTFSGPFGGVLRRLSQDGFRVTVDRKSGHAPFEFWSCSSAAVAAPAPAPAQTGPAANTRGGGGRVVVRT